MDHADSITPIEKAENIISSVLLMGVLCSAAVLLLGIILEFLHPSIDTHVMIIKVVPSASILLSGLIHLDSAAVLQLGIVLLLLTPVLRIIVSIIAFSLQGDHIYMAITTLVLCIVLGSILVTR